MFSHPQPIESLGTYRVELPGEGVAMKIDPNFVDPSASQNIGNTAAKPSFLTSRSANSTEAESSASDAGDTVELSGTLSEVQQLKTQLSQVPDERANRVAALQQQVQQGTYQPSNQAIAGALMSDLLAPGSST
jgi:flagellar biosynthesis anti-sigma factor FlgM